MDEARRSELRKLPQVERLIEKLDELSHSLAAEVARAAVDEARASVLGGKSSPSFDALADRARFLARAAERRRLTRVINATGVLLHTNLGRAPLGPPALRAMEEIASGYSNLEYDLAAGTRGSRYVLASDLLKTLTGAEAALVVNNNAAAVLLALAATARGREVPISRGELIEIGGGFRIPEILAESGALLREVGTTNRTHLSDYQRAISASTGALMKVHPSNYRVVGFAASVPAAALANLAHGHNLPLIHDLGSGLLRHRIGRIEPLWLASEPTVLQALEEGADVVTFSGDKLLGGPQAGLILGRADLLGRMHKSPLLRAFRVDKTTLAALEATLLAYTEGREADLPIWTMALADSTEIEARASELRRELESGGLAAKVELVDGSSTTGGGSVPEGEIPTVLLEIAPSAMSAADLIRAMIDGHPPIIARIEEDKAVLDLRTVLPHEEGALSESLRRILCT